MSDSLQPMNCSTPGFPALHHLPEFAHSCPLSQWCYLNFSSSVAHFFYCPQCFPVRSFPVSCLYTSDQIRSDHSLSRVRLFETPWIAARQASLSITNSWSSLRLTSIEWVMPSSHLILCHPLLLPPIPPSIRVLSNESFDLSKTSLNIWKFMFHVLLNSGLEDFKHYFTIMWDEFKCVVVWAFFGLASFWDWNKNWSFLVLWPLQSFPNLLAYWMQHFHSIIFQDLK